MGIVGRQNVCFRIQSHAFECNQKLSYIKQSAKIKNGAKTKKRKKWRKNLLLRIKMAAVTMDTQQVMSYEVAFVAKLLNSDAVKRGIEELGKKTAQMGEKAKSFFGDIRKFIPDLSIFNKLLGAIGLGGVLSFGTLVAMMPEADQTFVRIKQTLGELARFLGPILQPAFDSAADFIDHFAKEIERLEGKYHIFGSIAEGIKAVFDNLRKLDDKYHILETLASLSRTGINIGLKLLDSITDLFPEPFKSFFKENTPIIVALTVSVVGASIVGAIGAITSALAGAGFTLGSTAVKSLLGAGGGSALAAAGSGAAGGAALGTGTILASALIVVGITAIGMAAVIAEINKIREYANQGPTQETAMYDAMYNWETVGGYHPFRGKMQNPSVYNPETGEAVEGGMSRDMYNIYSQKLSELGAKAGDIQIIEQADHSYLLIDYRGSVATTTRFGGR